jgi:hypothetical protein
LPLVIGFMTAALAVVLFVCLQTDESAMRARNITEGFADILFVGAGGVLAEIWPSIAARLSSLRSKAAWEVRRRAADA